MKNLSLLTLLVIIIGCGNKCKKENSKKTESPVIAFFDEENMSVKIYENEKVRTLITMEDSISGMSIIPIWSPDGKKIMVTGDKNNTRGIWTLDAKDGDHLELFMKVYQYEGPMDWTEKAGIISDMKTIDDNNEIYILKDSTNYKNLTNNKYWDFFPTGHPDGRVVFWTSRDDPDKEHYVFRSVYAINHDGTGLKKLFEIEDMNQESVGDTGIFPDISPNGKDYVFTLNGDLYLINLDGSELRNLTNSPEIKEYTPAFSNDGGHIIFVTANVPEKENYFEDEEGRWHSTHGTNIFKIDIDGKNKTQITFGKDNDFSHPRYQPSRKKPTN
jgi:Tol biopolymer transport system component